MGGFEIVLIGEYLTSTVTEFSLSEIPRLGKPTFQSLAASSARIVRLPE